MVKKDGYLIVLGLLVIIAVVWFWPRPGHQKGREGPNSTTQGSQTVESDAKTSEAASAPQHSSGTSRDQARRQDHQGDFENTPVLMGQVTDPAYQGIAGASIQILTESRTIQSDRDGYFEWPLPPKPPTHVIVSATGFFSRYLQFPTGQENETIVLEPGGQLEVRVVDEGGQPVPNALVQSLGAIDQKTDRQGQASLTGVSFPTSLVISAEGFNHSQVNVPAEANFQEVTLLQDGALFGRVIDATTHLPVPRFQIKPRNYLPDTPNYSFNAKDGRFQITGLDRKQKNYVVTAEGYMTKAVAIENCLPLAKTEPLEIRLSDQGFYLSGRVVEANDDPIAKAEVTVLIGFEGEAWLNNFILPLREDGRWIPTYPWIDSLVTQTDARGQFKIGPFPEATPLGLIAMGDGFAPDRTLNPESLVQEQRLSMRIVLQPYGVLEGKAGQADSTYPRGITLSSSFQQAQIIELAPGESNFRIEKLIPGDYSVHFNVASSASLSPEMLSPIVPDRKEVKIRPGTTESIQIGFSDKLRMAGRIYFDAQPMANGTLLIQQKDKPLRHFFAQTDDHGNFELFPLGSGTYEIMANGGIPDYVFGERNRELVELEVDRTDLAINFHSMGSVFGRVVSEPVGATVIMEITYSIRENEFSTNRKRATVQRGGHFQFDNVPGGEFSLKLFEIGKTPSLLLPHQVMPDDGTDLDLGDLGGQEGNLLITLSGDESARHLDTFFFKKPIGNPKDHGQLLAQMSIEDSPQQLHGLESGEFLLQPKPNPGFKITPTEKIINIQEDTEAVAHFTIEGKTCLHIGITRSEEHLEFRNVRLVETATGKTWPIPIREQNYSPSQNSEPIDMYFRNYEIYISGIPAGMWQLTMVDQHGRVAMRQYTLLPGRPIFQMIDFDAFEGPRKNP